MSAASRLRERLAEAGVALALDGDGNLEWQAAAEPPAGLLAEAKRLKPELLTLLRSETANENGSALLSMSEITSLVAAIAGADPLAAPDRVREAACRMRRAGHARSEIASTLLPAVPLATIAMAARLALEDGWTDAEAEEAAT
ncbi:hypothetical protein [Acidibrevibacterium fodinaquatile]|uniref:hypothetical protein n=1 Tax=Acidibrevibacterium fodinaquatile TaxID=1969806 RepID=UPI000E0DAB84|nr:hypothetical protein [Acidibrevibacterium fodinaquatile]